MTAISSDGRYIAFASKATNLLTQDANGAFDDVFVYDRLTEGIETVHMNSKGIQGNGKCYASDGISISDDGRYVTYCSSSSNLVDNDTNQNDDVFIYDRQTKTNERLMNNGKEFTYGCTRALISGNGRYIAFYTSVTIASQDLNNGNAPYVYDRQMKTYELVNFTASGMQGNGNLSFVSFNISTDGRYVVFASNATNLASEGERTDSSIHLYIHDTQTKKIHRVDVFETGIPALQSFNPYISSDGRYVAFQSYNTQPPTPTPQTVRDGNPIYVRDMGEDKTPPSWPAGSSLSTAVVTSSEVTLNWTEAMGGVGIMGYKIYIGQTLVGSMPTGTRSYTARGLSPGATYSFRVEAFNQAEIISTGGPTATVTTNK
jgi:hypothetical protein